MPDDVFGTPKPHPERPNRKRQLTDQDQRSIAERVRDCLDYPLLYEMAELLPPPNVVGCPREYPGIVYLITAALTPVTRSKRSTKGSSRHPRTGAVYGRASAAIWARGAAAALPLPAPSRGQYQDALNNLLVPAADALEDAFGRYAAQQALSQGLFPSDTPKVWSRPYCLDSSSSATPPSPRHPPKRAVEIADEDTGLIRNHRVDPAARIYYENGEKEKRRVRGTKWFFASGRDTGYWTVSSSFAHVAGGEYRRRSGHRRTPVPHAEGRTAPLHGRRLRPRSLPRCPPRRPRPDSPIGHQQAARIRRPRLLRTHQPLPKRPRALVRPRPHRREHPHRRRHPHPRTPPHHQLEHRAGAKSRWYHVLKIPCRHGDHDYRVPVGITTTPADRSLRSADTGKRIKSDSERGFHRAEYLQQIPEASLTHQLLYPYRADSESVHSQFDQSLWNRRMIAYGVDRQKIFVSASPSPRTPPDPPSSPRAQQVLRIA